jgi:hypothetical protein
MPKPKQHWTILRSTGMLLLRIITYGAHTGPSGSPIGAVRGLYFALVAGAGAGGGDGIHQYEL